jgi:hypothetical protein
MKFQIPKLDDYPPHKAAAYEYRKLNERKTELGKLIPNLRIGTPRTKFPSRVVGGAAQTAVMEDSNIVTRAEYEGLLAERNRLYSFACHNAEVDLQKVQTQFSKSIRPSLIPTYTKLNRAIADAVDGLAKVDEEEKRFAGKLRDCGIASEHAWPEPLSRFVIRANVFDGEGRIDFERFKAEATQYGYFATKIPKDPFVCPNLESDPEYKAAAENLEKLESRSREITNTISSLRTTENPKMLEAHGFSDEWVSDAKALAERAREQASVAFVTPDRYSDIVNEQTALRRDIPEQERVLKEVSSKIRRKLAPLIFPHYAAIVQRLLKALKVLADAVQAEIDFADAMFQAEVTFGAPLDRVRLDHRFVDRSNIVTAEYFNFESAEAGYITTTNTNTEGN